MKDDDIPRRHFAQGLVVAAGRLEPTEAARVLKPGDGPVYFSRMELALGLAAMAERLEPAEAEQVAKGW